jgi:hypothetical protein
MLFFGKKRLQAEIEALKSENRRLFELGLKQAKEIKLEISNFIKEMMGLETAIAEKDSEIVAQKNINALQLVELEKQRTIHSEYVEATELKIKDLQSESELLLLQLHQVQEELESVFLKEQETQAEVERLKQIKVTLDQTTATLQAAQTKLLAEKTTLNETIATLIRDKGTLNQEKTSLTEDRDEKIKLLNERQAKIDSLSQVVDGKMKEMQQKNEILARDLTKIDQEKNTLIQEKHHLNQVIAGITQEKATLTTQRDEHIKLASDRQTKIDSMAKLIDGQLKEVQEENELLLLQLHQVQEELEHHFLEHQKLQRENEMYQGRWRRLEEREPQYLDYESILPITVDTVSAKPRLDWRATNITMVGHVAEAFLFTTFLEDGMPGVEITEVEGSNAKPVRLIPRALVKPNAAEALAQYRNMSMRDWQSLSTAIKAIEQFFKSPKRASRDQKLPDFFDIIFWRQTLSPLVADFKSLPAVFRFDEVKLKREQVNPDYEHLWMEFSGALFGQRHWPSLELRFAAANVQPGGFSRHPKVEIPKINGSISPFETWFEESRDDFGPKMELRFDLNRQFFDLDVWSRVSGEDRAMLISMMGSIPFMLKSMEEQSVKISRPWEDWNLLASGMVEILRRIITEAEKISREAREAEAKRKAEAITLNKEEDIAATIKDVAQDTGTNPRLTSTPQGSVNRFSKKKK